MQTVLTGTWALGQEQQVDCSLEAKSRTSPTVRKQFNQVSPRKRDSLTASRNSKQSRGRSNSTPCSPAPGRPGPVPISPSRLKPRAAPRPDRIRNQLPGLGGAGAPGARCALPRTPPPGQGPAQTPARTPTAQSAADPRPGPHFPVPRGPPPRPPLPRSAWTPAPAPTAPFSVDPCPGPRFPGPSQDPTPRPGPLARAKPPHSISPQGGPTPSSIPHSLRRARSLPSETPSGPHGPPPLLRLCHGRSINYQGGKKNLKLEGGHSEERLLRAYLAAQTRIKACPRLQLTTVQIRSLRMRGDGRT
ncbi:uncharacterized protein [Ovis canadensis]|uniref:uncharacterized protein n=1 Tax=Ovis canadensis TaxID=37174 RepID=UPI0037523D0A